MRNETRIAFNGFTKQVATINSVGSVAEKFTVTPSVQQKLEIAIQESSAFLKKITILGVDEKDGEAIKVGVGSTVAGRTDTTQTARNPRNVSALNNDTYSCIKTDFDTAVSYALLDAWAKFPNFQALLSGAIVERQALDRIMIGFNGTSAAATTNLAANPLLQDVNIGWLEHIRADAPARVMDEGAAPGTITVGPAGDYKNLDALVYDAYQTLLDPWFRTDGDLVAVVGRELLHDKLFPLVSNPEAPTEILAADIVRSQRRLGGLPAVSVPYFPANKVLITRLDNLSIYWQQSARRRTIVDNAKRDRIENYESSNDAYVVEDYGLAALVENIDIVD